MPTYYATLDWTYPEGERTPLGFEVAAYLSSGGSPNAPLALRQKLLTEELLTLPLRLTTCLKVHTTMSKCLVGMGPAVYATWWLIHLE